MPNQFKDEYPRIPIDGIEKEMPPATEDLNLDPFDGVDEMVKAAPVAKIDSKKGMLWKTIADANHSGYFIWEVAEVVGADAHGRLSYWIPTRDGGFIQIYCYHTFDNKQALYFLNDHDTDLQELLIVGHNDFLETPVIND